MSQTIVFSLLRVSYYILQCAIIRGLTMTKDKYTLDVHQLIFRVTKSWSRKLSDIFLQQHSSFVSTACKDLTPEI